MEIKSEDKNILKCESDFKNYRFIFVDLRDAYPKKVFIECTYQIFVWIKK